MIYLKNPDQIAKMRDAGALLYEVLQACKAMVKPGVTTGEVDAFAEQMIRKNHAIPSFLHYHGFPGTICASIDYQVVHGFPSRKVELKEGQIFSIDCGLILDGWQSDSALTVGVGEISPAAQKIIRVTEECFWKGIRQAVAGNRLGDIGHAVQEHAEANGFSIVRDLTGHGIGRDMHEDPSVFNYGTPGKGLRLRSGMTIAVEPMISAGSWEIEEEDNGWTYDTLDHSLSSHYEHTIAITDGLPEVLTLPGFTWKEETH